MTSIIKDDVKATILVRDLIEKGRVILTADTSRPIVFAENRIWELSTARADSLRRLMVENGLNEQRVARVVGHADRVPAQPNPLAIRNNRLEIILLLTLD